ncbi:hypothetical protein BFL36_11385 [Clavibacter michiganensis]|uniref:Uncharacterized protein n=1 Tax=Clavibacter michiganensis TaxID=28447 RepID=A0A251Y877_9MICO|nr:hypothetical protein BFL36_11385 [Clavibacter michiganensis]
MSGAGLGLPARLGGRGLLALPLADGEALLDGDARVAERRQLGLELGAAGLLLGERLVRPGLGVGRLLQLRLGDGGELGERVLRDGGLLAERPGGARGGDGRREGGVLAVGELGGGAHAGEERVGVLAAAREEAERDVAAAAPRELRDEPADLALGVVGLGLGLLGLGREGLRPAGRLVERVDRGRVLVGALEGEGRGRLDLAGQAGDEGGDARDLVGGGLLAGARGLHLGPGGVLLRRLRGRHAEPDQEGARGEGGGHREARRGAGPGARCGAAGGAGDAGDGGPRRCRWSAVLSTVTEMRRNTTIHSRFCVRGNPIYGTDAMRPRP